MSSPHPRPLEALCLSVAAALFLLPLIGCQTSTVTVDGVCLQGEVWFSDGDGDGYLPCSSEGQEADCDDSNADIHPGATEICDEVDQDCDGTSVDGSDADGDSFSPCDDANPDCDDADALIYPGATEYCDGKDTNCNAQLDDGFEIVTWYLDGDKDGSGTASESVQACSQPEGYVERGGDCNDAKPSVNPDAMETCNGIDDDCHGGIDDELAFSTYFHDGDRDGWGDSSVWQSACAQPSGWVMPSGDCNDENAEVHPAALETCNGVDDDCDGSADDGLPFETYYEDKDGDGYGNGAVSKFACAQPTGYVTESGDCDDSCVSCYPHEVVDDCANQGKDDDCDGEKDEDAPLYYYDDDRDGHGAGEPYKACSKPNGYVESSDDCDDSSVIRYPGNAEVCDTIDNDCDGVADEGVQSTFYADSDKDGYGTTNSTTQACDNPDGYVRDSTDCDDACVQCYPHPADDACGVVGKDDNCNGTVDEGMPTYYVDSDGDGYGLASNAKKACSMPDGYADRSGDCDDTNSSVNPKGQEVCDDANADEDCDKLMDDGDPSVDTSTKIKWYRDSDEDGYGQEGTTDTMTQCDQPAGYAPSSDDCDDADNKIYPGAMEICLDGKSQKCDLDASIQACFTGSNTLTNVAVKLVGETAADQAGYAVAFYGPWPMGAGEPSGIIIGAPFNGSEESGRVYYLPAPSPPWTATGLVALSTELKSYSGVSADSNLGFSVASGQVRSNSFDIVAGAPSLNSTAPGSVYLFDPVTDSTKSLVGAANGDLTGFSLVTTRTGSTDSLVVGAPQCLPDSPFGATCSGAAEGNAYFLVGPVDSSCTTLSECVRGKLTGTATPDINGINAGFSLAGLVATTPEGTLDVLLGRPTYDADYSSNSTFQGQADLVLGFPSSPCGTSSCTRTIAEATNTSFTTSTDWARFGQAVALEGDVSGEIFPDAVIGTPSLPAAGAVYGAAEPGLWTVDQTYTDAFSWTITGGVNGGQFGFSLATGGDVNGDGLDDLIVGAPLVGSGAIYIFFGPLEGNLTASDADVILTGSGTERAGHAVTSSGDVNGDGIADILIGANAADNYKGAAYLVYGGMY